MTTINPDALTRLQSAKLDYGGHRSPSEGACAMEWVSMLANEGFTDAPNCASPIIRRYTILLNDRWSDEKRQQLKPYLVRMIGTGSDGKDEVRREILRCEVAALVSPWLRLAGMSEAADRLEAAKTDAELHAELRASSSQAWDKRVEQCRKLAERVETELKKRDAAIAAASAIADTSAIAIADAATDTNAFAVAITTTDTSAIAVADAATDALAVAIAAADASAIAVAAAVAAADAGKKLEPYSDEWWAAHAAACKAAREEMTRQIDESDALADFRTLRDEQDGAALRILDKLITADEHHS